MDTKISLTEQKTNKAHNLSFIFLIAIIALHLIAALNAADYGNVYGDGFFTYTIANCPREGSYITEQSLKDEEALSEDGFIPGNYIRSFYTVLPHSGMIDYKYTLLHSQYDDHPPLYYMIVHTICYVFRDFPFTKWYALSINFICLILTDILLYYFSDKLIKNSYWALLPVLIYSVTDEVNTLFTFSRMYVMWTFLLFFIIYLLLRIKEKKESVKPSFIILFYLSLLCGCLTHLFFWIYASITCLFFLIYYIKEKYSPKIILSFIISGGAAVGTALVLWPHIIYNMLGEGSAENEAAHYNLTHISEDFIESVKKMPDNLFQGPFQLFATVIMAIAILITFVYLIVSKRYKDRISDAVLISVPVLISTLLVMKISPSSSTYYICPVFTVFALAMGCTMAFLMRKIYKVLNKTHITKFILCAVPFIILMIFINPVHQFTREKIPYIIRRNELPNKQAEYCIYVHDGNINNTFNGALFFIGEYDFVKEMTFDELIENKDALDKIEGGLTLFIRGDIFSGRSGELPEEYLSADQTYAGTTQMIFVR